MNRRTRGALGVLLGLAGASCVAPPPPARIADEEPALNMDPVQVGGEYFRSYCVSCHGPEGEGDGPLAELLKIQTTDLTRIAMRNDGVYPETSVREKIDGTDEVRAHGTRTMPVWGVVLDPERGTGGEDGERIAQTQIDDLLAFLESIQVREYR